MEFSGRHLRVAPSVVHQQLPATTKNASGPCCSSSGRRSVGAQRPLDIVAALTTPDPVWILEPHVLNASRRWLSGDAPRREPRRFGSRHETGQNVMPCLRIEHRRVQRTPDSTCAGVDVLLSLPLHCSTLGLNRHDSGSRSARLPPVVDVAGGQRGRVNEGRNCPGGCRRIGAIGRAVRRHAAGMEVHPVDGGAPAMTPSKRSDQRTAAVIPGVLPASSRSRLKTAARVRRSCLISAGLHGNLVQER